MPRISSLAFLLISLFALPLCAQGTADEQITLLNRQVLEACQEKKYDQALRSLEQLNALQPEHTGNAYNFACVYSLRGNVEEGLVWLERAVSWGFGGARATIYVLGSTAPAPQWHAQMAEKDLDLAKLRADPRFARLIERMRSTQKRVEEYTAKAGVFVPAALKEQKTVPVLVLLHRAGSDKEAALARWSRFAEQHGQVLLVPCAPVPMKEAAVTGMRWIDDAVAFRAGQDRNAALACVQQALAQLAAEGLQPASYSFAGEGEGGTLALLAAFANAKQTRGVCVVDPLFDLNWVYAQSSAAKESGLRINWIQSIPQEAAALESAKAAQASLQSQCSQWGLAQARFLLEPLAGPAQREQSLEVHLGELLAGSSGSLPPSSK
jgi:predicted esterase